MGYSPTIPVGTHGRSPTAISVSGINYFTSSYSIAHHYNLLGYFVFKFKIILLKNSAFMLTSGVA